VAKSASAFVRAFCRSHAIALGDAETKADLRKLAEEYVVQAEETERENKTAIDDGTSN
jgi:hypothetical protein